jgi:hypothetical protein
MRRRFYGITGKFVFMTSHKLGNKTEIWNCLTHDGKLKCPISTNLWNGLWNSWALRKNQFLLWIYMTEKWSCKTFGGNLLYRTSPNRWNYLRNTRKCQIIALSKPCCRCYDQYGWKLEIPGNVLLKFSCPISTVSVERLMGHMASPCVASRKPDVIVHHYGWISELLDKIW